jgi:hypothetical protein
MITSILKPNQSATENLNSQNNQTLLLLNMGVDTAVTLFRNLFLPLIILERVLRDEDLIE